MPSFVLCGQHTHMAHRVQANIHMYSINKSKASTQTMLAVLWWVLLTGVKSMCTFWFFHFHSLNWFHLHLKRWLREWRRCRLLFSDTICKTANISTQMKLFLQQTNILLFKLVEITFIGICSSEVLDGSSPWGQTISCLLKSFWTLSFTRLLTNLLWHKNCDEVATWMFLLPFITTSSPLHIFCNGKGVDGLILKLNFLF